MARKDETARHYFVTEWGSLMIEYRLHKNDCDEHGTEWFLGVVQIPRWAKIANDFYFGLLDFFGDPTALLKEKDNGEITVTFWGFWCEVFRLSENLQDRIFDFQVWLVTNRLATLKQDLEIDLDIWLTVSPEIAAAFDAEWVSSSMANEAFYQVNNINDIQW